MANRWDLYAQIGYLPPGNVADVYRFVAGMYATAEGRAMCDCCGRWIEDVRGLPPCGAHVVIMGKPTTCGNAGKHWKLTRVGPEPPSTQDGPK